MAAKTGVDESIVGHLTHAAISSKILQYGLSNDLSRGHPNAHKLRVGREFHDFIGSSSSGPEGRLEFAEQRRLHSRDTKREEFYGKI